jgi:uncharacterized protein YkwD
MDARTTRRTPRLAIVLTVALATIGPMAASPAAAANDSERQLRSMVNDTRDQHDRRRLEMRRFLVRAARRHSQEMAATGTLEHSDDLESVGDGRDWSIIGENIGYGPSMDILHDAFMDSPPHRQNELNRAFRYVGVGMSRSGDGRIWVTVLFLG